MKEEINQKVDMLPAKELKKLFEEYMLAGVKDSESIRWLKEFVKESFKLLSLQEKIQKLTDPTVLLKTFRIIIVQTMWLNRVLIFGFFVGIFFISLFSIINILD